MNKATLLFLCVFAAAAAPEAALAQAHICAYANDDLTAPSGLNNLPNTVDGYNISGGGVTYLPPVTTTRGFGVGGGYFAGGRGGAHVIGNNLYIENDYSRTIAHLVINPADCTLTYDRDYADGDLVSSKLGDSIAVAPNGKYLYVANNGNYFSAGTANIQMIKSAPMARWARPRRKAYRWPIMWPNWPSQPTAECWWPACPICTKCARIRSR